MKKIISFALILAANISAQGNQNAEQCDVPGFPDGSCIKEGYVCDMGFNVAGTKGMLYFKLSENAQCTQKFKSDRFVTYTDTTDTSTTTLHTTFFLIEDEYDATPVSVTLAGSLALAASLNGRKVSVVYKQVKLEDFGGVRLQLIEFRDE